MFVASSMKLSQHILFVLPLWVVYVAFVEGCFAKARCSPLIVCSDRLDAKVLAGMWVCVNVVSMGKEGMGANEVCLSGAPGGWLLRFWRAGGCECDHGKRKGSAQRQGSPLIRVLGLMHVEVLACRWV